MLGIGAIPSIFLAISELAMPESPRWLVAEGRLGKAKKVLYKISDSKEEAQQRLNDIKEITWFSLDCDDDIVSVTKFKAKTHESEKVEKFKKNLAGKGYA